MTIKRLMAEINKLYPRERINQSLERFRRVWGRTSPLDPPLLAQSWFEVFWPTGRETDKIHYQLETRLWYQLEGIARRGCIRDDFIPSLMPDDRAAVVPSIFGCKVLDRPGEHPWVVPMIYDPAEVYSLKKPQVAKSGMAPHVLGTIRYFNQATQGMIPIRTCDVQGPADVASMLMGAEPFLQALYSHPKEICFLLDTIADVIIEFYQLQIEAAEGNFIPTHVLPSAWLPLGQGVGISEDILVTISPAQYQQFLKPYNEKIAMALGGVVIHSCGNTAGHVEAILETQGLAGLHFGQMSLPKIAPLLKGRTVIMPACQTDLDPWSLVGLERVEEALDICKSGTYAILVVGAGGKIDQEAELFDEIRPE